MEQEQLEPEDVANVDLDGTLADYNGAMLAALESMRSPGEPKLKGADPFHNTPPWLDARMMYVKNRPRFWLDLDPIPLGMQTLELIREHFRINILTKGPVRTTIAWTEKAEWARRHVPDAQVTITEDKGLVYGRVLFDDWPGYITRWLKWRKRGLVLMLDHSWNQTFDHPQVVRIRGPEDFPRVQEALAARAAHT
jgi:5'-nucleotidase